MLDFGDPVCLDARLPGPGGRGRELELPTGQETLTTLGDGGEGGGEWGEWEGVGRGGGNGNFYNLIKFTKKKNWSGIDLTLIEKKLQKVHVDYVDPNIKCQILFILSSQ